MRVKLIGVQMEKKYIATEQITYLGTDIRNKIRKL